MDRNVLKNLIKWGLFGAALVLSFVGAPVVLALAAGTTALFSGRIADRFMSNSPDESGNGPKQPKAKARSRAGRESLLRWHGWNFQGLPLDMTLGFVNGRQAHFGAAGIDNLILAKKSFFGSSAEFSFSLKDSDAALHMRDYIEEKGIEAKVHRNADGGFCVKASDVEVINALAKEAYPKRNVMIERKMEHVKQFLVKGAGSFEEAKAMLESDPDCGEYLNSYYSFSNIVDGRKGVLNVNGRSFTAEDYGGSLPVGSFIVDMSEKTTIRGSMDIPGDMKEKNLDGFVSQHFDSSLPGVEQNTEVLYRDGTPEEVPRYFVYEANGHHVELRNPEDIDVLQADHLKAYVVLSSAEALQEILESGSIPVGSFVSVSVGKPDIGAGKYLLELDMSDVRVRDSLSKLSCLPASVQVDLDKAGIDPSVVQYSLIADRVMREGSIGLQFGSDVPEDVFSTGRINGLDVSELSDRLSNGRLYDLGVDKALEWAEDASRINYINLEVDAVKAEMRITSSVGSPGTTKVERLPLTEDDIASLSKRGAISRTEMKDLLIQLHPDYFKTYSKDGGKSIFTDPISSFLHGEKPKLIEKKSTVKSEMKVKKTEKKAVVNQKRTPHAGKGPKVG